MTKEEKRIKKLIERLGKQIREKIDIADEIKIFLSGLNEDDKKAVESELLLQKLDTDFEVLMFTYNGYRLQKAIAERKKRIEEQAKWMKN
jgi:hypothetical protein